MKISILSNLYPPAVLGGAELSAAFTAQELATRGHQVSIITIADRDSTSDENGLKIHRIRSRPFYSPFYSKKRPGWMKPAWHAVDAYNPWMASRVKRILLEERPAVLHCHNLAGFSVGVWDSARDAAVPVVQHLHDYHLVCIKATLMDDHLNPCPAGHFPCSLRAARHFRKLSSEVCQVISPSTFCAEKVFSFADDACSIPPVSIIPNGTDYAGRAAVTGDWEAARFRVLYLGALFEHKGFLVLKSMIERVNALPNRYEFDIGGTGPLEPMARELADRYPNVRFHGFVGGDAKHRLFREAHLFFFPSVWLENNPVSITEALAMGLPVLGSDTGGVPELLSPLSTELLFAPGSVDAACAKLAAFEGDRSLLAKVSKSLLACREDYSLARQVDRLVEVYRVAAEGA